MHKTRSIKKTGLHRILISTQSNSFRINCRPTPIVPDLTNLCNQAPNSSQKCERMFTAMEWNVQRRIWMYFSVVHVYFWPCRVGYPKFLPIRTYELYCTQLIAMNHTMQSWTLSWGFHYDFIFLAWPVHKVSLQSVMIHGFVLTNRFLTHGDLEVFYCGRNVDQ